MCVLWTGSVYVVWIGCVYVWCGLVLYICMWCGLALCGMDWLCVVWIGSVYMCGAGWLCLSCSVDWLCVYMCGVFSPGTGNGVSNWFNGVIDVDTATLNIIRGMLQI